MPTRAPETATKSISVPVRFALVGGTTVAQNERSEKWKAAWGNVSGEVFGAPHYPLRSAGAFGRARDISLDLSKIQAALDQGSATITGAAVEAGWKIEPADTRFARLATSILMSKNQAQYQIGFVDSVSMDNLLLVFFDRPCRLSGMVVSPVNRNTTYTIDVTIEKAGLNWLEIAGDQNDRRVFNAKVTPRPIFYVTMLPRLNTAAMP